LSQVERIGAHEGGCDMTRQARRRRDLDGELSVCRSRGRATPASGLDWHEMAVNVTATWWLSGASMSMTAVRRAINAFDGQHPTHSRQSAHRNGGREADIAERALQAHGAPICLAAVQQ